MSDPVFLRSARSLSLDEIASLADAEPLASKSVLVIGNIASLDRAGPSDLAFFDDSRFAAVAAKTHAGACLTTAALAPNLPARVAVLVVQEPFRAFVTVARALFPQALRPSSLYPANDQGKAHAHPSARLENDVVLEPGAVIGPAAEVGAGTVIAANAVIGTEVRIGRDCLIGAGASIGNALIGDRVIVHAGCRIGQDGFGFSMDAERHIKIPQVGRVIIQDDVEIGAGATIDRGFTRDTVIGEGTMIDNLVQVSHNANIGRYCVLGAQTAISGSSTLEDFAVVGARAGDGSR
jgi:UDP-3-O-[3-hydroxymyristoyl] glucosamine N-acyltransferase